MVLIKEYLNNACFVWLLLKGRGIRIVLGSPNCEIEKRFSERQGPGSPGSGSPTSLGVLELFVSINKTTTIA